MESSSFFVDPQVFVQVLRPSQSHGTQPQWSRQVIIQVSQRKPLVGDNTPTNARNSIELTLMSDTVIEYEKEHFPIGKPTVAQLIEMSLEDKKMSQKQLALEIGVSPSRISDYVSGRAEPTLKIARLLCQVLNITPAAMMGC